MRDFLALLMTAANAPSPYVASATTELSTPAYSAFKAFRFKSLMGGDNPFYFNATTGILTIDLGAGQTLDGYAIVASSTSSSAPKTWTFEGSNDNSNWTTLDTRTNQTDLTAPFAISSPASFRYYRLNVTANNGHASICGMAQLLLLKTESGGGGLILPRRIRKC